MEAENQPSQPPLVEAKHQSKGKQPQPRFRKETENPVLLGTAAKRKRSVEIQSAESEDSDEIQPNFKRLKQTLRSSSPVIWSPEGSTSHEDSSIESSSESASRSGTDTESPNRNIKMADTQHRSWTPHFPTYTAKTSTEAYHQAFIRYAAQRYRDLVHKDRSKLHRANLRAQRDFPFTLQTLAYLSEDSDSEYIPISRPDSIVTSGQLTPESSPELITKGEELFGFRARPITPAPSIPSPPRSPAQQATP